ncbi:hypothetical protein MHBO_001660 [Bonamia ostreae]|uniref:RRM domain-containing protein n=1 Tax=Bonamia ostreae TaxID=126728 RepID=A0ABV2AJR2_9EUKA
MSHYQKPKNETSRCVFVGNIPYDSSEQELIQLFKNIGNVLSFRTVTDRDTGKPKGYGFCEFSDHQTAVRAIRTLNNIEFYGRALRVDYATVETNSSGDVDHISENQKSVYKTIPVQIEKPTLSEEIVNTIKTFSYNEKTEILENMKALIDQNRQGADLLLQTNPQLGQALLAILMTFNLVTSEEVKNLQEDDVRKRQIMMENNDLGGNDKDIELPMKSRQIDNNSNNKEQQKSDNKNKIMEQLPDGQREMLGKLLKLSDEQISKMPEQIQKKVYALKQKVAQNSNK